MPVKTTPAPFLNSIAREYSRRYNDLSRFIFVFPNRRSGTFFRRYLHDFLDGRKMLAPEITTISDFIENYTDSVVDSRIDLIFTLFNSYRSILSENGVKQDELPPFESFRKWGDVVLADFNDADMFDVDVCQLFKNVRDFREISTDFLTDEQRELMAEYFGMTDCRSCHEHFWNSYDYHDDANERSEVDIRGKFMKIWELLAPLYERFNSDLASRGYIYSGHAYREFARRLNDEGPDFIEAEKIVFIGFNALSKTEWLIFNKLSRSFTKIDGRTESLADFFWDGSGFAFESAESSASRFIHFDRKNFPQPEWADISDSDASGYCPEITVIASPSNSMQAKITGKIVGETLDAGAPPVATAVVLPDESLLLPMLSSLPDNVKEVNLTMGYELRLTSVASFIDTLLRMQKSIRKDPAGNPAFRASDVRLLASHPFVQKAIGLDEVMRLRGWLREQRKFMVTEAELMTFMKKLKPLCSPLPRKATAAQAITYLDEALKCVAAIVAPRSSEDEEKKSDVSSQLDYDYICVCRNSLRQLAEAMDEHSVSMSQNEFFFMLRRMLGGETVDFQGEPLKGLQIMGLLETRCLDFSHLVIPSVNERIFPMRLRRRSFIPDNLRRAYGMASASYQESIFAYYFYRIISRAQTVTLLYDSRSADMQTGDPSRYIHQLLHLYPKVNVREREFRFSIVTPKNTPRTFAKDDAKVRDMFDSLHASGKSAKYLSASSLQTYLDCPVQFYLRQILGIYPEEETEGIDAITQGSVFHHAAQSVYLHLTGSVPTPEHPCPVLVSDIDRALQWFDHEPDFSASSGVGESIVHESFNHELYKIKDSRMASDKDYRQKAQSQLAMKLSHSGEIVAREIYIQIRRLLECDRKLAPFDILGLEIKKNVTFDLDGKPVNFTFTLDRLDRLYPNSARPLYRIVDYKTGSVHMKAASIEDASRASYDAKAFFQLQLYANLLKMYLAGAGPAPDIQRLATVVYDIPGIVQSGDGICYASILLPDEKKEGSKKARELETYDSLMLPDGNFNDYFMGELRNTLRDIFDMSKDFEPTKNEAACTYCRYANLCRQ